MRNFFTVILLSISFSASAQFWVVKGNVLDSAQNKPLKFATVVFIDLSDSTAKAYSTNDLGGFRISSVENGRYQLSISYVGFKKYAKNFEIKDGSLNLGNIQLGLDAKNLQEVTVEGLTERIRQNGDTTEMNAAAYKVNPDATAEDLVEKMPGVVFSNGQVQAQGENVARVLVDGREFFGDDPNAALKNLPAEMIEKIQIYDQASDQAQFTGFEDGETSKTMNIITKVSMRNGEFGKVYAGAGTDETYNIGGSINLFRPKARTTILAQTNNINIQNFSTSDLLGITSGGGRRGGGGRGGRGGGGGGAGGGGGFANGGNASNFQVGQQGGINETRAFGINYSYEDAKRIKFSGSYFFNQSDNSSDESIFRQFTLPENEGQTYAENSFSPSRNTNHRFNGQLEYKIDDKNSIIMRPRFTFQDNSGSALVTGSTSLGEELLNQVNTENTSALEAFSFSNNILFRHAFAKRGRTFSINLNTGLNNNNGESFLLSDTDFFVGTGRSNDLNQFSDSNTDGFNMRVNATYTEPLADRNSILFTYAYSYQFNDTDTETFDFNEGNDGFTDLNIPLSNTFENDYYTHRGTVGYNLRGEKGTLTVRGTLQHAILDNDQTFPFEDNVDREFNNFVPNVNYRYRVGRGSSFSFNYRASTNAPSVNQLQSVIDNTDPLNISSGNPELDQRYQHSATIRYNKVNAETSHSFFTLLSSTFSDNYIGNSTTIASRANTVVDGINLQPGATFSKPVNLTGYWNVRSFISYGMPLGFIKSNLNFTGSLSYTQTPELINDELNNAQTPAVGVGIVLSSNISEKVDFTISSNSTFSTVSNTLQTTADTDFFSQATRLRLNWIFGPSFVFRSTIAHTANSGLSDGFNQNFILWNMEAGKKLLKDKAELKLTIFDLLKQNQNIRRSITGSYIEDNQTQILTQYFMLSFVYNIRSFGQGQTLPQNDRLQQLRQRFGNGQGGFGGRGGRGGGNGNIEW
ncbi:outer membrane beta-barrel protein [Roseivirga sp.]|uniref:outer membrane beta-barrel protein n=1 Tax=Roseivirga sp. TaxID=1964215 RepID=UPI003B8DF9D2